MPIATNAYALLDSGRGQKLEQFGRYTLIRPEPKAFWEATHPQSFWSEKAHARFTPAKGHQKGKTRGGSWEQLQPLPESWVIEQKIADIVFKFRIAPSSFGHVGLFPEQADNWAFIARQVQQSSNPRPKVLNLFAYTGAASIVARGFGAEVYHVDSSRPVINQARTNMEINDLSDIRWVYEDAFKFAKREANRGRKYSGIILDPPPAGRGPKGEKWKLEEQLDELLAHCAHILDKDRSFLVMSLYAMDWPHEKAKSLVRGIIPIKRLESGDCLLPGSSGTASLSQGTYVRCKW